MLDGTAARKSGGSFEKPRNENGHGATATTSSTVVHRDGDGSRRRLTDTPSVKPSVQAAAGQSTTAQTTPPPLSNLSGQKTGDQAGGGGTVGAHGTQAFSTRSPEQTRDAIKDSREGAQSVQSQTGGKPATSEIQPEGATIIVRLKRWWATRK